MTNKYWNLIEHSYGQDSDGMYRNEFIKMDKEPPRKIILAYYVDDIDTYSHRQWVDDWMGFGYQEEDFGSDESRHKKDCIFVDKKPELWPGVWDALYQAHCERLKSEIEDMVATHWHSYKDCEKQIDWICLERELLEAALEEIRVSQFSGYIKSEGYSIGLGLKVHNNG